MNAFVENSSFERAFTEKLFGVTKPMLEAEGLFLGRMQRSGGAAKQDLNTDLQKGVGDFLLFRADTHTYVRSIDLKVERDSSPNLFFETWSNYSMDPGKWTLGWGHVIKADRIWFAFEDAGIIAVICLKKMRAWLVGKNDRKRPRSTDYREVEQQRHPQANLSRGLLIPFKDIPVDVWSHSMIIEGDTVRMTGRDEFLARLPLRKVKR